MYLREKSNDLSYLFALLYYISSKSNTIYSSIYRGVLGVKNSPESGGGELIYLSVYRSNLKARFA